MSTDLNTRAQAFTEAFLSRRGIITTGAAASTAMVMGFGFTKTKEIEAQQLTGTSLYDQLGGIVGISTVVQDMVGFIAGDARINSFFAGTIAGGRAPRLIELLIQQIAEASGGPVKYTGMDMKTAHRGMGITIRQFGALVEDLVMALDKNKVPDGPKNTLLGALAPMAGDIVERAF